MKNIYYLSALENDAASFYRTNGVLPYLNNPEIAVKNIFQNDTYDWQHLAGADIFIVQRPFHDYHVNLIKMALDMGIKVISDYDDDLLNVPFHNNASITLSEQRSNIKQCLHLSNEIWVTTPAIVKAYKPFNRNIHVIPNAHNDYIYPLKYKRPFNKNSKIMSYRGGASHEADMYQNINDVLTMINGNQDWTFRFQGSRFKHIEDRTGKNHEFTDPSTIMQFYNGYHDLNANLAFFPLIPNLFNASKSNIAFLEATYAGSAFMGNKQLPEFNLPFVTDISGSINESFLEIKDNIERQENLNFQAWNWIVEYRLLSEINKLRADRILI